MAQGLIPMDPNQELTPEELERAQLQQEMAAKDVGSTDPTAYVDPTTGVPTGSSVAPQNAPAQSYQQQFADLMNSPEYQALSNRSKQAIEEQKKGVGANEEALNKLEFQSKLAPLAALSDAWTGSNFSATTPTAEKVLALRNSLQAQKQGLTQQELALLKDQLSPLQKLGTQDQRQQGINLRTDTTLGKIAGKFTGDKVIGPATLLINGADRIQDLLDKVKQGKIVDTGQFINNLTQEQAKLESGKTNFSEGTEERTAYDSGAKRFAALLQKVTANPQSANMPKLLNELQKNIHAMRNAYAENIANQTGILKSNYSNPKLSAEQERVIRDLTSKYGSKPEPSEFKGFATEGKKVKAKVSQPSLVDQSALDAELERRGIK